MINTKKTDYYIYPAKKILVDFPCIQWGVDQEHQLMTERGWQEEGCSHDLLNLAGNFREANINFKLKKTMLYDI